MKVTFCKTNAGNGFKIIVNNKWLYASKDKVLAVIDGDEKSCQFGEIQNFQDRDNIEESFDSPFTDSSNESH